MARPIRLGSPGAVYHVTSRGNARQAIFLDKDDVEACRGARGVQAIVFEGLQGNSPWERLKGQILLGTEDFLARLREPLIF